MLGNTSQYQAILGASQNPIAVERTKAYLENRQPNFFGVAPGQSPFQTLVDIYKPSNPNRRVTTGQEAFRNNPVANLLSPVATVNYKRLEDGNR